MLLDNIEVNSADELFDKLRLLLDSNAIGNELISIQNMSECQFAIGMELSTMLMREYNETPQKTWHTVLSVLRLLPWQVDPENAFVTSEDGIASAVYRYFGGLDGSEHDHLFDTIRNMASQGSSWQDILQYACMGIKGKV